MKPTQPTRLRDVAALAVVAGVVCWLAVRQWYGGLPRLHWFVPLSLGVLAVAEAISGFQLRARIRGRPGLEPIDPLVAARQLALAKASAMAGAVMLGAWAGLLAYLVPRLSTLGGRRRRRLHRRHRGRVRSGAGRRGAVAGVLLPHPEAPRGRPGPRLRPAPPRLSRPHSILTKPTLSGAEPRGFGQDRRPGAGCA